MYDRFALGNKIREYRLRAGLTQERFAELIGRSTVHVSHMERGVSATSMDTFVEMCRALAITPNDLLEGQFSKTHPESEYGLNKHNTEMLQELREMMRIIEYGNYRTNDTDGEKK